MPTIEFIADAEYDEATENGGRKKIKIAKGTVQENVSEGTAGRWERRGKAKRVPSRIERVTNVPSIVDSGQPVGGALGARGGTVITQVVAPPPPPVSVVEEPVKRGPGRPPKPIEPGNG